jgi:CheY-like chemotaxis protein
MDLHMPKVDGYTCTKRIRELGYKMPIIASTANGMTGEKEKCLNIGMNDYLLKPVQLNEFKIIINKWINQDYYVPL